MLISITNQALERNDEFIMRMRSLYANGKLKRQEILDLESMPGWTWSEPVEEKEENEKEND
jgi:hypothetical protein